MLKRIWNSDTCTKIHVKFLEAKSIQVAALRNTEFQKWKQVKLLFADARSLAFDLTKKVDP